MRMTEILLHGGRPKGSGVVRFEHYESADKAVGEYFRSTVLEGHHMQKTLLITQTSISACLLYHSQV